MHASKLSLVKTNKAAWRFSATALLGGAASAFLARNRRMEMKSRLAGKVVLITGGSRGLGLLLAREYLKQGASVSICARDERELTRAREILLPANAAETRRENRIHLAVCDISRREQVRYWVHSTVDALGGIDVIVNNAGIIQVGPFQEMTEEDVKSVLDVHLWGMCFTTWEALPFLRESAQRSTLISGRRLSPFSNIVNITSLGGVIPVPHLLPYSVSKFAAVGWSETLKAELAPEGVRVFTVVPGLMRTGSHFHALFKGQKKKEMNLFSLAASFPGITLSADRAAKRIVRGTLRGEGYLTVGMPAKIARLVYAAAPNLVGKMNAGIASVLPGRKTDERTAPMEGQAVERKFGEGVSGSWVTGLGRRAAKRNNEKAV